MIVQSNITLHIIFPDLLLLTTEKILLKILGVTLQKNPYILWLVRTKAMGKD